MSITSLSSVDPDRGVGRRRHSDSPNNQGGRRRHRPPSLGRRSPEGESIDRIVDMAIRMADDYGGGGDDRRGGGGGREGNLRKGGSMEKYITTEDRR